MSTEWSQYESQPTKEIDDSTSFSEWSQYENDIEQEQPVEKRQPVEQESMLKDLTKQSLIGMAEGTLGTYGDILDIVNLQGKEKVTPGHKALIDAQAKEGADIALLIDADDDIMPRYAKLPSSEDIGEFLNLIGIDTSKGKTTAGKYGRRVGSAVGGAAAFGGEGALALAGGALAGQTAEELGASPGVSSVVEFLSSLGVGGAKQLAKGGKVIAPKGKEAAIEMGRKIGLTEQELTPIARRAAVTKGLARTAKISPKTEEIAKSAVAKTGESYDIIKKSKEATSKIKPKNRKDLLEEFHNISQNFKKTIKMTPDQEAAVKYIDSAMENLQIQSPTGEELINTFQNVNSIVDWHKIRGGKKILSSLKEPIKKALGSIDKGLAQDFDNLNSLYGFAKEAEKVLKSPDVEKFISASKVGLIVNSMATLDPKKVATTVGVVAGATGFRKMLDVAVRSPYFQALHKKLISSLGSKEFVNASKISKQMKKELEKEIKKDKN